MIGGCQYHGYLSQSCSTKVNLQNPTKASYHPASQQLCWPSQSGQNNFKTSQAFPKYFTSYHWGSHFLSTNLVYESF